jgi:hypothetical protein
VLCCACTRDDAHLKGVLEYSRVRAQRLCVPVWCTYVRWYGVHACVFVLTYSVCSYVYSGVLKEVFFCVSICIRNYAPRITHVSCMKSVFVAYYFVVINTTSCATAGMLYHKF